MNRVSIVSDNGLLPIAYNLNQRWVIINWTNFSEILIKMLLIKKKNLFKLLRNFDQNTFNPKNFCFTKLPRKISSAKWRLFCPGGDEWTHWGPVTHCYVNELGQQCKAIAQAIPLAKISVECESKSPNFSLTKCIWISRLQLSSSQTWNTHRFTVDRWILLTKGQ